MLITLVARLLVEEDGLLVKMHLLLWRAVTGVLWALHREATLEPPLVKLHAEHSLDLLFGVRIFRAIWRIGSSRLVSVCIVKNVFAAAALI